VTTTISSLPAGTHTVTLRVNGTRHAASSGTWVRIDGTIIGGVTNNAPTLKMTWPNVAGDHAYTYTPGASVSLRFYGTEAYFWWLDEGDAGGFFEVVMDGRPVTPSSGEDLGNGYVVYRYRAPSVGMHTMRVNSLAYPGVRLAVKRFGVSQ
jgi:hypothetical protein